MQDIEGNYVIGNIDLSFPEGSLKGEPCVNIALNIVDIRNRQVEENQTEAKRLGKPTDNFIDRVVAMDDKSFRFAARAIHTSLNCSDFCERLFRLVEKKVKEAGGVYVGTTGDNAKEFANLINIPDSLNLFKKPMTDCLDKNFMFKSNSFGLFRFPRGTPEKLLADAKLRTREMFGLSNIQMDRVVLGFEVLLKMETIEKVKKPATKLSMAVIEKQNFNETHVVHRLLSASLTLFKHFIENNFVDSATIELMRKHEDNFKEFDGHNYFSNFEKLQSFITAKQTSDPKEIWKRIHWI